MMTTANKNILERYFWHRAIPLLSSGNQTVTAMVRIGGRVHQILQNTSLPLKVLFWSAIGLSIGLGIGILIG
jgi:hypothetical protein